MLQSAPGLGPRIAALTRSLQADDSATRAALGWTPPVPAAEGLARTARAFALESRSRR
jgi:nucleoside-diphosphate-sugar epimerase